MTTELSTIVIGGGMAGVPIAIRAARHGPTALVEGGLLGGTCLNRGCIPTKTMIHSAKIAHLARRAVEFGVDIGGEVSVDLASVVDRKNEVVASVRSGSYRAVERAADLELIEGWAQFVGPRTIEVDGAAYAAERIVINTGARPHVPDIPGLQETPFLDSTSALDLRELPDHLIVFGGGYVGCEFAQMYRRFGSEVTVVSKSRRLLPSEETEVGTVVEEAFEAEGITVLKGDVAESVSWMPGAVMIQIGGRAIVGSHLLVATGRAPNTEFGLAAAGVEVDARGFVKVGADYATTAPSVFAIGDVVGPPMFTHAARDDASLLYRSVFRGADVTAISRLVPHAVFTDPEVAAFGMSEPQAKGAFGDDVFVGTQAFRGVAKARAIGELAGFVKIVAGPERQILGATIVGPDAGNLIHELVAVAVAGGTVDDVRDAVHIHPTLAEAVNSAAGGVHRPTSG